MKQQQGVVNSAIKIYLANLTIIRCVATATVGKNHPTMKDDDDSPTTDTDDLEFLGVALGDTDDHVLDQRTGRAVHRTGKTRFSNTFDADFLAVVRQGDLDLRLGVEGQVALRTGDSDFITVEFDGHAAGDADWFFTVS